MFIRYLYVFIYKQNIQNQVESGVRDRLGPGLAPPSRLECRHQSMVKVVREGYMYGSELFHSCGHTSAILVWPVQSYGFGPD